MNGKLANLAIMCFNPSAIVKTSESNKLKYVGFAVPALTFMFYFWQYGIDKTRMGLMGNADIAILCIIGFITGPVLIALTAAALKIFNRSVPYTDCTSDIGFTFTLPLLINFLALLLNAIFKINTSAMFGMTGVLFSLIPMFDVICASVKKNRAFLISIIFITAAGTLYTVCPAIIFMLKG